MTSQSNFDWSASYLHPSKWNEEFPPLALHTMFFNSAAREGKKPMLDFMGRKYSYAEMAKAVRHVAAGLQRKGIGKGDHIGLFLPNLPHYVAAYYGALAAGATVVNFSPLYSVDELTHQVGDSGTSLLFTVSAAALLPTALKVLDKSALKGLIVGSVAEALPAVKGLAYRLFKRGDMAAVPDDRRIVSYKKLLSNDGIFTAQTVDPEKDVAQLQYTGGTTGTPKGAMLTHNNLSANARQVHAIDPHPGMPDRILGALPLFHVFANTCVLNRTVLSGGCIVMLPRFNAAQALGAIGRSQVTAVPGVPTMYQALLDNPALAKTNFSHLRVCISGGAPLPSELKSRFERATGAVLIEGYGLSESSGVVAANPYEAAGKPGTIGQPIPATRIALVDKEDPSKPAPEGEPGEIIVAGPQIMKGYWQRPEADAEVFVTDAQGTRWLRTGDVGTIDADGFVKIVDRLKDMIAVGGFKVFPSQIEAVLYTHPAVKEALVIGIPDTYRGEFPRAYVTLNDGATETGEALAAWLNPQLGKHERVDQVVVRLTMPKTMIGKLSRKDLVAEVLG